MSKQKKPTFKLRAAGIALLNNQVLIYQTTGNNYWSLPGGCIEKQEDSRAALEREFLEETGLLITVNHLVWVNENFFTRPNGKQIHEVAFYYTIDILSPYQEKFIGRERDLPLLFQWVETSALPQYVLKPDFLISALQKPIPVSPQHLIIHENNPNRKAP